MEKKSQIYLSAFLMYIIVGFAGYINQFSNYWVVFILATLVAGYAFSCIFTDRELLQGTKIDWISLSVFYGLELILTVLIGILKLPYVGFFKYFNYTVQVLGILFVIYYIIRFVISFTKIDSIIKEKFANRRNNKHELVVKEETIASQVEQTIESEVKEANNFDENDVEVVGQEVKEPEVIGIEYKKEKEPETPYMEEEL